MRRVKDLREGEYEDWILKVSDALLQAGMHAMFNITGVQRDELADAEDLRVCSLYPQWALNTRGQQFVPRYQQMVLLKPKL